MSLARPVLLTPLLRSALTTQSRRIIVPLVAIKTPPKSRSPLQSSRPLSTTPIRRHSVPPSSSKIYDYAQIKSLTKSPSPSRILIDVREPSEYASGFIPTAINIPIKSQPDALFLPADEFEDRFGFEKPGTDKEVVFYCRSGVRSNAAAQLATQGGYGNVAEYRGSWLDWEKNGGGKD